MECRPIVVGIAGITSGGKTLLCSLLKERFPMCSVLHMDDYFWPVKSGHYQYLAEYNFNFPHFDVLSAINFVELHRKLQSMKAAACVTVSSSCHQMTPVDTPLIFVEGTMLFDYKPMADEYMRRFFITLNYDVALMRRRLRVYTQPDPESYFPKYVWPAYLASKENASKIKDVVFLDGTSEPAINVNKICEDLKQFKGLNIQNCTTEPPKIVNDAPVPPKRNSKS